MIFRIVKIVLDQFAPGLITARQQPFTLFHYAYLAFFVFGMVPGMQDQDARGHVECVYPATLDDVVGNCLGLWVVLIYVAGASIKVAGKLIVQNDHCKLTLK